MDEPESLSHIRLFSIPPKYAVSLVVGISREKRNTFGPGLKVRERVAL